MSAYLRANEDRNMTDNPNAPTYDELLAKFNEANDKINELTSKMNSYEDKLKATENDLKASRALNTKLMFNDPTVKANLNPEPGPEHEPETLDQFLDSFANEAAKYVNAKHRCKIYDEH